jgi:hypothetical protein
MRRVLHIAILHNAALLVPGPERSEWLAEWKAELHYVDHDATSFCFGSFRDALWLRSNCLRSPRRGFSLDSPLRCVFFLAALALLVIAAALPFHDQWLPAWSLSGVGQVALGCLQMHLLSLLVLVALNPMGLGEYPLNPYAPSLTIRLRRWAFLAVKIALLPMIFFFASIALLPIFPGAPSILMFGWIFGLRWALDDQRHRCPVCLHLLSNPTRIGSPAKSILDWYGTELICTRGHGLLYVPGAPTSWCSKQRWQYLDPTWSTLHS